MDVIEIDGASNNGVEQVRELRDSVRYAPAQCRFKIYIIDEVHMLSPQAFNALLKTLEEPHEHVKFVFATTEGQKVLPTIISRCQRFDLKPISDEVIIERLKLICAEEGLQADDAALAAIARMADGGMRDSQSMLDQMIAFCGDKIGESDVLDVYGLVSKADITALATALAEADFEGVVNLIDRFDSEGRDLFRVLADLQVVIQGALLDSVGRKGSSDRLGRSMTTEALARLLDGLREGEASLKFGLSEKVNFEVTLIKAIENSRARAIDSLIRELSGLAVQTGESAETDGEKKKPRPNCRPRRRRRNPCRTNLRIPMLNRRNHLRRKVGGMITQVRLWISRRQSDPSQPWRRDRPQRSNRSRPAFLSRPGNCWKNCSGVVLSGCGSWTPGSCVRGDIHFDHHGGCVVLAGILNCGENHLVGEVRIDRPVAGRGQVFLDMPIPETVDQTI